MTEEKKEVIKNQSETEVSKKVEDAKKNDESNSLNEKILPTKKTEEKKPEKTNDTSNLSNSQETMTYTADYDLGGGLTIGLLYFDVEQTANSQIRTDADGLMTMLMVGF